MSVLVLGCGLLILVSLVVPFFQTPAGEEHYPQWLAGGTVLLGVLSVLRKERGPLAGAAAIVAVSAVGLLILTFLVPAAYGLAMRVFMPD